MLKTTPFHERTAVLCLSDAWLGLEVTIEDVSDSIGALARGTDVDKPRNLAKSVTVE